MEDIIQFCHEYEFLSNFYPSEFTWENNQWPTVEHAFQAAKTLDPQAQKEIREVVMPGDAKRLGRTVKLRDDWEEIKISIMTELVLEKFDQNPLLMDKLLDTQNAKLIEGNCWHDNIWGDCFCNKCSRRIGQNWLGTILMEVRNITREQNLREAVRVYIEAKVKLTLCMQEHFRQVCHPCREYARCLVYAGYVETWMNLQKAYKIEDVVEKE